MLNINSMKGSVAGSAAIFEGRVESMEIIARHDPEIGMEPNRLNYFALYTFTIERSYKGQEDGRIIIASGLGGGDCNVPFEVGSRYLVLASVSPSSFGFQPYLETDICNGTNNINFAHAQIGFLRGEITTQEEWKKLENQMQSPLGANAKISGRINGFKKDKQNVVQTWRIEKEKKVPFCSRNISEDGSYEVSVLAGSYMMRALQWPVADPFLIGYYPSADRFEEAVPVDVLPGQHLKNIDFGARKPATHTVRGKILQTSLGPIAAMKGMFVELEDRDGMALRPRRRSICRPNGTFEFKDVYPGRYHVIAHFRFEDPDPNREWRADVPIIQVPEQRSGVVLKVRSIGGSVLNPTARRFPSFGWVAITFLLAVCLFGFLIFTIRMKIKSRARQL